MSLYGDHEGLGAINSADYLQKISFKFDLFNDFGMYDIEQSLQNILLLRIIDPSLRTTFDPDVKPEYMIKY